MIEQIKPVGNPLTIVAIFAALAEILSTVALGLLDPELQKTFIWFVMLFPVAIVAIFFLTLNYNPKVLYAPKDFVNEAHFIELILANRNNVEAEANSTVNEIKETIVDQEFWDNEKEGRLKKILENSLSTAKGNASLEIMKFLDGDKNQEELNMIFNLNEYKEAMEKKKSQKPEK